MASAAQIKARKAFAMRAKERSGKVKKGADIKGMMSQEGSMDAKSGDKMQSAKEKALEKEIKKYSGKKG